MEHFSDILLNEGIVARDSSMVKLYSDALSIAPTDANILIVGASGTGKDCLAKFIATVPGQGRRSSTLTAAPFRLNCLNPSSLATSPAHLPEAALPAARD